MTDSTTEEVVEVFGRLIAKATLGLFVVDQHRWSDRPCQTCKQITTLLGEPWGCYKYQLRKSTDEDRQE